MMCNNEQVKFGLKRELFERDLGKEDWEGTLRPTKGLTWKAKKFGLYLLKLLYILEFDENQEISLSRKTNITLGAQICESNFKDFLDSFSSCTDPR